MQPQIINRPQVIDADIFQLNGETVSRVIMEIGGHVVQLVNSDTDMIAVDIDNKAGAVVHILAIDEYINGVIGA